MIRFWERLSRNPSWRSTQQLYTFLQHNNIPLTPEGKILAYKAVRSDWMDFHSGKIANTLGVELSMPRNQISDDPNETCHVGFHVGALAYAESFGDDNRRILVCEVDPEHVVSVPYDASAMKMRVCQYKVVGLSAAPMNSTVQKVDDVPSESDKEDLCPECFDHPCCCDDDCECGEFDCLDCFDPLDPKPVAAATSVSAPDLEGMTLDQLRRYAAGTLKMVGASKIPGGKMALLQRIRDLK